MSTVTFTPDDREVFIKTQTNHPVDQGFLRMLIDEPLKDPDGKETNYLDYLMLTQKNLNGNGKIIKEELDVLFGKTGLPHRKTYIKEMVSIIETRKKKVEEEKKQFVAQPAATEEAAIAPAPIPAGNSRYQKMLSKTMTTEICRMVGMSSDDNPNIMEGIKSHYHKELTTQKKFLFTGVLEDVSPEKQETINVLSMQKVFIPLFGAIPGKKQLREIEAASDTLAILYQGKLFPKSADKPDEDIQKAFKEKILNTTAKKIQALSDDDMEDILTDLEPSYAPALAKLKGEVWIES